jgi:hypothetical protein
MQKNIRQHSYYESENEVLLLVGTQFQVIGQYAPSSDIHVIQLKEIQSSVFLTNLSNENFLTTPSKHRSSLLNGAYTIMTTSMNNIMYRNPLLEQDI